MAMRGARPRHRRAGVRVDHVDTEKLFREQPGGSTPLPEVLARALRDHAREAGGRGLLLLVLTDGEANSMPKLNTLLDAVQNGAYGDVQVGEGRGFLCWAPSARMARGPYGRSGYGGSRQCWRQVCLVGLSLLREDVDWFENEECDDSRVRTVEPFEMCAVQQSEAAQTAQPAL